MTDDFSITERLRYEHLKVSFILWLCTVKKDRYLTWLGYRTQSLISHVPMLFFPP